MKKVIILCFILLFSGCIFTPPKNSTILDHRYDEYRENIVLDVAFNQLGVPYRYGGITPDGFDCSGFVCYVYKNATGILLPRTAQKQSEYVKIVPKERLKAGDLLFFDTHNEGRISHCGIYIGENKFIHASSGKAYSVTISNLNSRHYKKAFRFGGRVFKKR